MYFVTGTDTNIGKTLVSAALVELLTGIYWKPIQAGEIATGGDTGIVKKLTGLSDEYFLSPIYNLKNALSPNQAADLENVEIDLEKIILPQTKKPLIIEGAGGIMVPLNKEHYMLDLIKKFNFPVILVARSGLGTLNHIFLSVHLLEAHGVPIKGIVLIGDPHPLNVKTLEGHLSYPIVAQIPFLSEQQITQKDYKRFFLHKF